MSFSGVGFKRRKCNGASGGESTPELLAKAEPSSVLNCHIELCPQQESLDIFFLFNLFLNFLMIIFLLMAIIFGSILHVILL